jgi:hypothetical protein
MSASEKTYWTWYIIIIIIIIIIIYKKKITLVDIS